MAPKDIFDLAEKYYSLKRGHRSYVCDPLFLKFSILDPVPGIQKAIVSAKYGKVTDIELYYNNGDVQWMLADKEGK